MVGEACSRKGTFRPDRGLIFLSGLRLASSKFRKFVRISDLAEFFFCQNLPIFDRKSPQTKGNDVLNNASLVISKSYGSYGSSPLILTILVQVSTSLL